MSVHVISSIFKYEVTTVWKG